MEQTYEILLSAIKAEVNKRQMVFEMSDFLKEQIIEVAQWLTNDSYKFGLLLCGRCGNGKTTLIKSLQQVMICSQIKDEHDRDILIELLDARTVTQICKKNIKRWEELCQREMLAIDDVGIEPVEVLDFGNVLSPLIELLTRRYDQRLITIISTNLTPEEIRSRYGERIADRLNEMMVKIIYKNKTFRK